MYGTYGDVSSCVAYWEQDPKFGEFTFFLSSRPGESREVTREPHAKQQLQLSSYPTVYYTDKQNELTKI